MNQTESPPPPPAPKTRRLFSNVGCLAGTVVVVVVVFFALLIPLQRGAKPKAPSMKCVSNLKQISLAAIIWAHDRGSNQLPSDFLSLSNELGRVDLLVCPEDRNRPRARDWASFTSSNCSYEIVGPGARLDSTNAFVRCPIHGRLGLADGNVVKGAIQASR